MRLFISRADDQGGVYGAVGGIRIIILVVDEFYGSFAGLQGALHFLPIDLPDGISVTSNGADEYFLEGVGFGFEGLDVLLFGNGFGVFGSEAA